MRSTYRDDLPQRPERMARLPLDERGYPIPFFVGYVGGRPDFRVFDPHKLKACVERHVCWLCGDPLGRYQTYAIGPMCAVNRVSSEPPSHLECARYAARACPFLVRPRAQRREANFPDDARATAGVMVTRNPGVVALWTSKEPPHLFRAPGGFLFRVGEPCSVEWFAEGRPATPSEVRESFDSGVEILRGVAREQQQGAEAHLDREVARALAYLPEVVSA